MVSSGSADLGLVVVGANTGKITFWENVELADGVLMFGPRKQGVEGTLPRSLHSGEIFLDLIEAQHAGFLLRSSSGRIAHITIRDTQGRPHVTAQLLDSQQSQMGLLGSFKKIFSGSYESWQLAAVKTRPSAHKGHVEVVALLQNGTMTEWDITWAGQQTYRREVDLNKDRLIADALRETESINLQSEEEFKVLDFSFLSKPISERGALTKSDAADTTALLLLVAIRNHGIVRFALVECLLFESDEAGAAGMSVGRVQALEAHRNDAADVHNTVSLRVPEPEHTAFVFFDKSVAIVSLVPGKETLNSEPNFFSDVLHLQTDSTCDIIGLETESPLGKHKTSSALLITKRSGIARLIAEEPHSDDEHLAARTKIEQAIYFGSLPTNILDLNRRPDYSFSTDELNSAILKVASDILTSHSEHIPPVTQSALDQLNLRGTALLNLATFVNSNYPDVSRETKWQLLWNAEKIAAVRGVWAAHERRVADGLRIGSKEKPLLVEIVDMAHEKRYRESSPSAGESRASEPDWLRKWFVLDARSIERIVPHAFNGMQELYKQGKKDTEKLLSWTRQSDELILASLGTALQFRQENAARFGLEHEVLRDGVLRYTTAYESMPEFWTSRLNVVNAVRQLTDFARVLAFNVNEQIEMGKVDGDVESTIRPLAEENAGLVDIACRVHLERQRWLLSHKDDQGRVAGERWRVQFETDIRPNLITNLASLGQAERGMELAERFNDVDSLVRLSLDELRYYDPEGQEVEELPPAEKAKAKEKFESLKAKVNDYFTRFGGEWVEAFYGYQAKSGMFSEMLDKNYGPEVALKAYLSSNSERAKLDWLYLATDERNLVHASERLMAAASHHETNAWAKQSELSIAKLLSVAVHSQADTMFKDGKVPAVQNALDKIIDSKLGMSRLQTKLYNHVKHTAYLAIDPEGGLELVMQTFGKQYQETDQPAHVEILKQGFEQLLGHAVVSPKVLIDILTLMDSVPSESPADDISGKEFLMALQLLHLAGLEESKHRVVKKAADGLLKMIWKRCFIRDDWRELFDRAQGKEGGLADVEVKAAVRETALGKTLMEGSLLCRCHSPM